MSTQPNNEKTIYDLLLQEGVAMTREQIMEKLGLNAHQVGGVLSWLTGETSLKRRQNSGRCRSFRRYQSKRLYPHQNLPKRI